MPAISGVNSSASIGQDYLTLMVAQLQNQNPLDPMSSNDMTSQLAQISSLERLESIDNTFQKALLAARLDEAMSMIGRQITFVDPENGEVVREAVETVGAIDGDILLKTENHTLGLDAVQMVSN